MNMTLRVREILSWYGADNAETLKNAIVAGPATFGTQDYAAAVAAIRAGDCLPARRVRS